MNLNRVCLWVFGGLLLFVMGSATAGLSKSVVQVDPGNTKLTGDVFIYRLSYSCDNTSTDCFGAEVIDQLPPEIQYVSHVATSDVDNVSVVGNLITFDMIDPLPAGNSGDLLINVRFPNGSTPNGTVATNTADGVNLETVPGTNTTPPVDVTAVASSTVNLSKTLQTPADLDLPTTYRLRLSNPGGSGGLNVSGITVADTLPAGVVYQGSTPAADCEPACVGTVSPALTWSGPFNLNVGNNLDFNVTVVFPSATFTDGQNVTNEFTADGTPLGEPATNFGIGSITHPVTTFVADPDIDLSKNVVSPNPPTFNQDFSYSMRLRNVGNVDLANVVITDVLPLEFETTSVTSGAYSNLTGSVTVSYQTNLSGTFVALGTNAVTGNTTYNIPALGAGEYVTHLEWSFSDDFPPGVDSTTRPRINGRVINPDNAGGTVNVGDSVQNCAGVTSIYDPSGVNQTISDPTNCPTFSISGPFVQLRPIKDELSSGPYLPGDTINWRLRVTNNPRSSDVVPLEDLVVTDLLPIDFIFTPASNGYDDNGTGLPAPNFSVIENYNNTGRTLLNWTWPAASGNLAVNDDIRVTFDTTVRLGASFGNTDNTMGLTHNNPGLGIRCGNNNTGTQGATADIFDQDQDGLTNDTLCQATNGANISPVAQLSSVKEVRGVCDADFTTTSSGTLLGTPFDYRLTVINQGTLTTEEFVFMDILPFVGDTGVLDTSPRDSLWEPVLLAPITPPPGTVVYYSTSGNPCRPEVGGPTSGCDAPNWSTSPPVPLSDTKSFKVEFEDKDVQSFDTLQFELTMFAPTDTPTSGEEAYNSFAYRGFRADGLGALSAEPNKVGMAIGSCPVLASLGDYVWLDNNVNGIQDDGNTGVNDVLVQLFDDGADGIPNTLDDTLVTTTVTADDVSGNPGWYQFVRLLQDTYYVCFQPPASYQITDQDVGGNDAIDSDVNPTTLCTDPVFLPNNSNNPDLDLGLVGPLAGLGNYVWWDLNSDGVQNEPVDYGVNGVTVNLYADDGDGTPNPALDTLLVSQVTGDDLFGNPGYYEFGELIPGVSYFVEFIEPSPATGFTTANAGGDDGQDSDANVTTGLTPIVVLAAGEFNPTIDAGLVVLSGNLSLGNQVWFEDEVNAVGINNGIYDPQFGEPGLNQVDLDLYLDVNNNNQADINEYITTTATQVSNGFNGRYLFEDLAPGNYIVVVGSGNFAGNAALAGLTTCTANDPVTDPDDDQNGDDDGTQLGGVVVSLPITLTNGGEPITDGDDDNDSNLTNDFCFTPIDPLTVQYFDYGDAVDTGSGASANNYQTTALDGGAVHEISTALNSPVLGACVDADNGMNQNAAADADDGATGGIIRGTCAMDRDDEDGVVFSSESVLPGDNITLTLSAAAGFQACFVNGWIDWNQNGVFENTEVVADELVINPGTSVNVPVVVPLTVNPGSVYSRFRCNDGASSSPANVQTAIGPNLLTDPAPLGEVEDYVIEVIGQDLGDAPDSYATLLGSGGPTHLVDPNTPLFLGACVDTEADGSPSANSMGDDTTAGSITVGLCFDDEDGVVFNSNANNELTVCAANEVTVVANQAGFLDAWVDLNGNGTFDAADQIASSLALVPGSNSINFNVPCDAFVGGSHSRFRFSTSGGLSVGGPALDGEVEDHAVIINGIDLGDAPATYPVTLANTGASHGVSNITPMYLGSCVDTEADGQPSVDATADDSNVGTGVVGTCAGNDDEDGVVFTSPIATCLTTDVNVTANATGLLDAWFDFNNNGSWNDAGEKIFDGVSLTVGVNALQFTTPCNAMVGDSNLRFRYSTAGSTTPDGAAIDGEVEDYQVSVQAFDMGDNPISYGTMLVDNGPLHLMNASSSLFLGSCVDAETDGQANATADGDDVNAGAPIAGTCSAADDEDGVTFDNGLTVCEDADITVTASAPGSLNAFVDFNADGVYGAGEQVFTDEPLASGANTLTFNVPCAATPGSIYSRFRLSSGGGLGATGLALDGEVEDYVLIKGGSADLTISKSDDVDPIAAGGQLTYTITVDNLGPNLATNVVVTDSLPAGVTLVSTSGCAEDPNAMPVCSLGDIAANGSAQYTVTVDVDASLANNTLLTNNASVTSDTNDTDPNNNDTTEDTTVIRESDLQVSKTDSVDPATAGEPLTYFITVENLGPSDANNVVATESLPADVTFIATTGCAEDPAGVPNCSLGNLAAGGSVQYQVLVDVNPGFEGILNNTVDVTSDSVDNNPPNNTTTEPTIVGAAADLTISKVDDIDPAPPGTTLTYTIAVTNNGPSVAQNVVVTDNLPAEVTFVSSSGCAEDPNGVPTCSLGNMNVNQTVSYQVVVNVNNNASGTITNTASVTATTPDPNTSDNTTDEDTTVESADLSITKVDDVDPVAAGDLLTYTIRVDNAGPTAADNVVITDVLPPEVTLVATNGCAEDPNGIPSCSLGSIQANEFVEVQVTVRVDDQLTDGTVITNNAAVTSSTDDPDTSNNNTSEPTDVVTVADLELVKEILDENGVPVSYINTVPGDDLQFRITVTNLGPSVARNVVVTDVLSTDLTLVGTTGCAEDPTGIPTCSLGDMNVNQSSSYLIDTTINADAYGSITNTADVNSDTTDPEPNNNEETVTGVGINTPVPVNDVWFLLLALLGVSGLSYRHFRAVRQGA